MNVVAAILVCALVVISIFGACSLFQIISNLFSDSRRYEIIVLVAVVVITLGGYWGLSHLETNSNDRAVAASAKELSTEFENKIENIQQEAYSQGYESGYNDGANDGYDSGYLNGHREGHDEAYVEGHREGYDEAYTEGRDEGYDLGYDDAANGMEYDLPSERKIPLEDDGVDFSSLDDIVYVWITDKGTKYHIDPYCSNMKSPREVVLESAQDSGYEPCDKCY